MQKVLLIATGILALGMATACECVEENTAPDDITFGFLESTTTVSETNGTAALTVVLSKPLNEDLTFRVEVETDTATAEGEDYTIPDEDLTIDMGETNVAIRIAIIEDALVEGDELLTVSLSGDLPPGVIFDNHSVTITIRDDDTAIIGFTNVVQTNAEDGGPIFLAVELSKPFFRDLTLRIGTSDDLATAGEDYTALNEDITIPRGDTRFLSRIDIENDTNFESDETFTVMLSGSLPEEVIFGDARVVVTIRDDDTTRVGFTNVALTYAENSGSVSLVVELSKPFTGESLPLLVSSSNGTATAGEDYRALNEDITIMMNETRALVNLVITDDDLVEDDETFSVWLSGTLPTGVSIDAPTIVTIREDDRATVDFTNTALTYAEDAGSVPLLVRLTGGKALADPLTLDVSVMDGTATAGEDYSLSSMTLTVNAGDSAFETVISLNITNDSIWEVDETFIVTLSGSLPAGVALDNPSATVTISQNDNIVVGFDKMIYVITNGESTGAAEINVKITEGTVGSPLALRLRTQNGSARAPADYTAIDRMIVFNPGQNSEMNVSIPIIDDAIFEIQENFFVELSNPPEGVDISTRRVEIRIIETGLGFRDSTSDIHEDAGSVTLTVIFSTEFGNDLPLMVSTSDGTAIAGEDYTALNNQVVTLSNGHKEVSFQVPILPDTLVEGDQNFTVAIVSAPPPGLIFQNQSTIVTIEDDDSVVVSLMNNPVVDEDVGTVDIFITADKEVQIPYSVNIITVDGFGLSAPALEPDDYIRREIPLTFIPGEREKTLTVEIVDDNVLEFNEMFIVRLEESANNPSGLELSFGEDRATVTILDMEMFAISIVDTNTGATVGTNYELSESAGEISLEVRILGISFAREMIVAFSFQDGNAVLNQDYSNSMATVNGQLVFFQRTVPPELALPRLFIIDDSDPEPDETFTLMLSLPSESESSKSLIRLNFPTVTITIRDDD